MGFPGGSVVENRPASAGDTGYAGICFTFRAKLPFHFCYFMKEYLEPKVAVPIWYQKLYYKHRRTSVLISAFSFTFKYFGFSSFPVVKNPPANAGDVGSIPGSERSPEGKGNPLQYSCLENPIDRGAWRAIVHGVAKSWTRLSAHAKSPEQDILTHA